ncbi:unnamed protein product [Caenorhabditis sp. 36 PRJEB53466]|nr:unnamed protein product [Caenorhabditis sp. 36 PRJEB53466]
MIPVASSLAHSIGIAQGYVAVYRLEWMVGAATRRLETRQQRSQRTCEGNNTLIVGQSDRFHRNKDMKSNRPQSIDQHADVGKLDGSIVKYVPGGPDYSSCWTLRQKINIFDRRIALLKPFAEKYA